MMKMMKNILKIILIFLSIHYISPQRRSKDFIPVDISKIPNVDLRDFNLVAQHWYNAKHVKKLSKYTYLSNLSSWELENTLKSSNFFSDYEPQQIHLSFGNDDSMMYITYNTIKPTKQTFCYYKLIGSHSGNNRNDGNYKGNDGKYSENHGKYSENDGKYNENDGKFNDEKYNNGKYNEKINSKWKTVIGTQTKFVGGGIGEYTQYVHRCKLDNLELGSKYYYQVSDERSNQSLLYTFNTKRFDNNYKPKMCIFGDFGLQNDQSIDWLTKSAKDGNVFDFVLHNGDIAYDLSDNNETQGDFFMNLVQPIAANYPYMVGVGNHEAPHFFNSYINRFTMPYDDMGSNHENMWYSFNIKNAHILVFSSEVYYGRFWNEGVHYDWVKKDLELANQQRHKYPWIIALAHRPFYCSPNDDHDDCHQFSNPVRTGLEPLFSQMGVDLVFTAHEHSYERFLPLYNYTVKAGDTSPYVDPYGPVHIVGGVPGNREKTDPFQQGKELPFSVVTSQEYGVGIIEVHNHTHLYYKQIAALTDEIVDELYIVQHYHQDFTKSRN